MLIEICAVQIGGHERALRKMAAVDMERGIKIVKAQAFYRGHLSRKRTAAQMQSYMAEKEVLPCPSLCSCAFCIFVSSHLHRRSSSLSIYRQNMQLAS